MFIFALYKPERSLVVARLWLGGGAQSLSLQTSRQRRQNRRQRARGAAERRAAHRAVARIDERLVQHVQRQRGASR